MTTEDRQRPGSDGYDPLLTPRMIWRGKWILLLSLIAGAGGGMAYLRYAARDSFEAESKIVVERQRVSVQPGSADPADFLSLMTQVEVIRSPLILGPAIKAAAITAPEAQSENQLIDFVLSDLTVEVVEHSNVISIRYRNPRPQEAARLVACILQSYSAFVESRSQQTRSEVQHALARREESLSQRETQLQNDLRHLYERYHAMRNENSNVAESSGSGRKRLAFASIADRIAEYGGQAHSRNTDNEAIRPTSPSALDSSPASPAIRAVAVLNHPASGAIDQRGRILDQLLQAQMREAQLLKSRGPRHADVTAVREQIDVLNAVLEKTDGQVEEAALFSHIQRIEALWDTTFQQLIEVQAANEVAVAGQPKISIQNLQGAEVPVRLAWPRPIPFLAICLAGSVIVGCGLVSATDRLRRA